MSSKNNSKECEKGRLSIEEENNIKSRLLNREDRKYTDVEKIKDEDLLDFAIFGFYLRCDDFKKDYEDLEKDLVHYEFKYFETEIYNKISKKFSQRFVNYGYSLKDLIKYILKEKEEFIYRNSHKYNTHGLQINRGLNLAKQCINNKIDYIDYTEFDIFKDYIKFEKLKEFKSASTDDELEEQNYASKFLNSDIISYSYKSSVEIPILEFKEWNNLVNLTDKYREVFKNITINTTLPIEITLKQVTTLISEIYKEKDLSSMNIINPDAETISLRKMFNRQNKQLALAEYFYIYDNVKNGVPKNWVKNEIDKYREKLFKNEMRRKENKGNDTKDGPSKISNTTVIKRYEDTKKMITNKTFLNLIW